MTCKISPETLMTLYEQALPWWHALFLKTHTPWCTSCQAQLTSFSTLDGQLRALAPIPVEIALAPIRRRRTLLGSSLALAVLGLGSWRFFTPEIEWLEVREEVKKAKSISWNRKHIMNPITIFTDPTEWLLRKTKLTYSSSEFSELVCIYNRLKPLELQEIKTNSENSRSLYSESYLEILAPESNKTFKNIDISQMHRLTSFTIKKTQVFPASNRPLITSEISVILADPQTCRIVQRTFYRMHEGRMTSLIMDTDFKYQYD